MKIPYLQVAFDTPLRPEDISAFRGGIVACVGRDHDLFHNHSPEGTKLYRYPLIQYKRFQGRAGLVGIGEGVEALQHYLGRHDRSIDLRGQRLRMDVARITFREFPLRPWHNWFSYRVEGWLALHGLHLQIYHDTPGLAGRLLLLERKLNSNIRAFTRAMGWSGDGLIEVRIHHMRNAGTRLLKDIPFRAFDVEFSTNVSLPAYIGLGKGAAFGHGVLHPNPHRA